MSGVGSVSIYHDTDDWSDHDDYSDYLDYRDYSDYQDHRDWGDYQDYDDYSDHDDWSDHTDWAPPLIPPFRSGTLPIKQSLSSGVLQDKKATLHHVQDTGKRSIRPVETVVPHPGSHVSMVIDIVTTACNLDCHYCHENPMAYHDAEDWEAHQKSVSWLFSKTMLPRIKWIFHGGEPLLLGRNKVDAAVYAIAALSREHNVHVSFGIQTNGTLLSEAWIDWFERRRIRVGVSLDGPPLINDVWRKNGCITEKWLRRLAKRGVRYGIVSMLNRANVQNVEELVNYYLSIGAKSLRFNPCWQMGRASDDVIAHPDELVSAKRTLLHLLMENSNYDVNIDSDLASILRRNFAGHVQQHSIQPGICSTRPCGAGRNLVAMTPSGKIITCGRALNLAGNIGVLKNPGEDHKNDTWIRRLNTFHKVQLEQDECRACIAQTVCTGGCPSFLLQKPKTRAWMCEYWRGIKRMLDEEMQDSGFSPNFSA